MTADTAVPGAQPIGALLRGWRQRRRISQLDLSIEADVSTRHLSFVETGRSRPSRDMVLLLSEALEVPLRERNRLLLAAGFAPVFPEAAPDGPGLEPLRGALRAVLAGHDPYPAVVVDSRWNLLEANAAVGLLLEGVSAELLEPPVNVLRVSLHPGGMAPRVANLGEWRAHLLDRLERQSAWNDRPDLAELHEELRGYPGGGVPPGGRVPGPYDLAVPLRLRHGGGELAFLSTVATFGTAVDVTLSELTIEAFLPADPATAAALRANTVLSAEGSGSRGV
ncbi:helix-turn-helix domain-containing protein [Nocardiopsis sp. NPDC101807]|uniref:helix-turn-helix domain-containing protein n=1 Tax=Nocardiopsis sp. NPDC101807 TaxID=3364339 RepID=UPI003801D449